MQRAKRSRDDSSQDIAPPHSMASIPQPAVHDDAFINDNDAAESGNDDDDDEDKPKADKKAGRRKIKIEFIQDKSRRHITFSKRKAGIMKKAYELSTLTGTQVLLLVVSETGLVYTFTTAKLQPLVTQPEGKNLIQACLNAPQGTLPSTMPVGAPMGRSSGQPSVPPGGGNSPGSSNLPGGLSIGSGGSGNQGPPSQSSKDSERDEDDSGHERVKRPRRDSNAASPRSPNQSNATVNPPAPLSIPTTSQQQQQQSGMAMSPTSPQQGHPAPPGQYSPSSYSHAGGGHDGMYSPHGMPPYYQPSGQPSTGGNQQLGGLAAAAAVQHGGISHGHGHWSQPSQGQPYVRR